MKTITLVRHGQSTANAGGITMPHGAIPLSALGALHAQVLATLLPSRPSCVLVSAYLRAQQTAQPYCDRIGMPAQIHPLLHEFSAIDPALLEGMDGVQRRPIADAYWQASTPDQRMGAEAETFIEFDQRVADFLSQLPQLPDGAVLFGHGMWIGMLAWKLLGFSARDSAGMRAFRRFQSGLPMPNGAVYHLRQASMGHLEHVDHWHVQADEPILRALAGVRLPAATASDTPPGGT
jgi:alpha-ribazole phosphatase